MKSKGKTVKFSKRERALFEVFIREITDALPNTVKVRAIIASWVLGNDLHPETCRVVTDTSGMPVGMCQGSIKGKAVMD